MKKNRAKILWLIIIAVLLILSIAVYQSWNIFFASNIDLKDKESTVIFIPTNSNFDEVVNILSTEAGLKSAANFRFTAQRKSYGENIRSGRYRIKNNISNNSLVNMLRSGNQEPIKLKFNNIRTIDLFCERVSQVVEFSSEQLCDLLKNDSIASSYGFNKENFATMFIPNTYELFWNVSPEKFVERMHTEYKRFWTKERLEKAERISLNPIEVSILASIVESETIKRDEMPKVAGLYINRLRKGMRLEADPTVKFALGDFELKRILFRHLEFVSPYNTYLNHGLPPGPICFPEPTTIDAVLNFEKHDYIFMCAKDDFSGYHAFARTHAEHSRNAARYHQALNRLKIR